MGIKKNTTVHGSNNRSYFKNVGEKCKTFIEENFKTFQKEKSRDIGIHCEPSWDYYKTHILF